MIDTVMVIWTSGLWKRFLRTTGMLMLLFTCVCTLSYLITSSRDRWSGLIALKTQSSTANPQPFASDATATAQPEPAPTAQSTAPYVIPIVLQNPIQPDAVHSHKHTSHAYQPAYTPPPTRHTPPTANGSLDSMFNALQNLP